MDEAIAAGCIPVIIADFYDPPFQELFEYSTFSVRISENDVRGARTWTSRHARAPGAAQCPPPHLTTAFLSLLHRSKHCPTFFETSRSSSSSTC